MSRLFAALTFVGLLTGGALVAERSAHACVNPQYRGDTCACRYGEYGYQSCLTNGWGCIVSFQCGDGGGTLPP